VLACGDRWTWGAPRVLPPAAPAHGGAAPRLGAAVGRGRPRARRRGGLR